MAESLSTTAFFHRGSHGNLSITSVQNEHRQCSSQGSLHTSVFSYTDSKNTQPLLCMNTVGASRLAHREELLQLLS